MINTKKFEHEPVLFTSEFIGSPQEGFIVSTQTASKLPFSIKRVFWSFGIPETLVKGNHAHRQDLKILVAITGSISIKTETQKKENYLLNSPFQALYVPALCWITLHYAPGSILLALSSTDYDEQDYIYSYEEFKQLREALIR